MSGAEFSRTGFVGSVVFVAIAVIVVLVTVMDCRDYSVLVHMTLMVSIWRVGHSSRDWLVGHSSLMAVMVSSDCVFLLVLVTMMISIWRAGHSS